MNVSFGSKNPDERILSNFAATPFEMTIGQETFTHHVPGHSKPIFKMEKMLMSPRHELYGY